VVRETLAAALGLLLFAQAPPRRLVIGVSTLLDGRGAVLHDTRIVVEGSRIVAFDPAASPVDIDLRGLTVMPGWIDTHVHLSWYFDERGRSVSGGDTPQERTRHTIANADATLRSGFTTVQSLGAPIDGAVRDAIARGEVSGPRIRTSLRQIGGTSGTPDALRALVRKAKVDGADVIKLLATAGLGGDSHQTMSDAQLDAACTEAAAAGLRAVVHAVYDSGARAAVTAGCTSIEHGTFVTDATLKLMAERGTWFDPNLLVWHNYIEHRAAFGMSDDSVATVRDAVEPTAAALRRARALGVRIIFGTDAVAGAHGRNAEEFIYRVRDAHEKPTDVLMSATSLAADSLGLGTRIGTIAAGFDADLVATEGNLLDDITAVRRVKFVMIGGKRVR
jgi:imidazolonepropionase-like amidohydrolase